MKFYFNGSPNPTKVALFLEEAGRHYGVLDGRLAQRPYLVGDAYSLVDMAAWGWARMVPFLLGDDAWGRFPNLKRWFDEISGRPAAARAQALKDRFAFKTTMDEEARAVMFKHLAS